MIDAKDFSRGDVSVKKCQANIECMANLYSPSFSSRKRKLVRSVTLKSYVQLTGDSSLQPKHPTLRLCEFGLSGFALA